MKKITLFFTLCAALLFLMCGSPLSAEAADVDAPFNIEQAIGKAPEIKAYVNGTKINKSTKYAVKLTGIGSEGLDFAVDKDSPVKKFKDSGEGISYYVLLDNSKSVNKVQFDSAKHEIINLRKKLRKKDTLRLYAIGSDTSDGSFNEVKLSSSSDPHKNVKGDCTKISSVKRNKQYTLLYKSIKSITDKETGRKKRSVILAVTDGDNCSEGKDNSVSDISPYIGRVPIYGILLKNDSSEANTGNINDTVNNVFKTQSGSGRGGRGYYEDCSYPGKSSSASLGRAFSNIKSVLFDKTYVVNIKEKNNSNRPVGNAKLTLTAETTGRSYENSIGGDGILFTYVSGKKDKKAPVLDRSSIKKESSRSIRFRITDVSGVTGAENTGCYTVKDKKGRTVDISKVNSLGNDEYEIVFKEDLVSGKYTLTVKGITDGSYEKNELDQTVSFEFKGVNGTMKTVRNLAASFWWLLLIIVVVIIGAIVITVIRKKKPGDNIIIKKFDPGDFDPEKAATRRIQLYITDMYGNTAVKDITANGSIFVGRSPDVNDVSFKEDRYLSNQHFVIEITQTGCYVTDLGSSNTTKVNGVKIFERRKLENGDEIQAGMERMIFSTAEEGQVGERS